jgi:cell division protein FtsB
MKFLSKFWYILVVFSLFIVGVIFNQNFKNTLQRRKMIRNDQQELNNLTHQIDSIRQKISSLEKNPASYEKLVRSELGYLRPGEKEVRFLRKESHP